MKLKIFKSVREWYNCVMENDGLVCSPAQVKLEKPISGEAIDLSHHIGEFDISKSDAKKLTALFHTGSFPVERMFQYITSNRFVCCVDIVNQVAAGVWIRDITFIGKPSYEGTDREMVTLLEWSAMTSVDSELQLNIGDMVCNGEVLPIGTGKPTRLPQDCGICGAPLKHHSAVAAICTNDQHAVVNDHYNALVKIAIDVGRYYFGECGEDVNRPGTDNCCRTLATHTVWVEGLHHLITVGDVRPELMGGGPLIGNPTIRVETYLSGESYKLNLNTVNRRMVGFLLESMGAKVEYLESRNPKDDIDLLKLLTDISERT